MLRGLAGLAMVVNHAAVALVPASAAALLAPPDPPLSMGPAAWASFLGSFAPMIFFFVTGVGYGLQARPGGVPRKAGLWPKVAALLLADALLWRSWGLWIGLDFFGFIAASMALLAWLNRLDRRRALLAAGVLLAAVSALRYAAVPAAERLLGPAVADAVAPWVGQRPVRGVSFPPMPWLGYPLVGFWVGAGATAFAQAVSRRRWAVAAGLVAVAAAAVAAAAAFIGLGHPLHRWERLSPSSYAAGFGVVALLLALCLVAFGPGGARPADGGPRRGPGPAVRGLSLRGVAAFAVVPLHFGVLAALVGLGVRSTTTAGLFLWTGLVAALALGLAPRVAAAADRLGRSGGVAAAWWSGLGVALLALGLLSVSGWGERPSRVLVASLGQLALCLPLALPPPWRAAPAPAAAPFSSPLASGPGPSDTAVTPPAPA